jgi:hypothetical protein
MDEQALAKNDIAPNYSLFLTPVYIISLLLLLANDFVWKAQNSNWITGKLSDFCGLFCIAVFLDVLIPNRKLAINLGLVVLFTFWKSPLSDVAIGLWNALIRYHIARIVDYSDLFALLVLPFAYLFSERSEINITRSKLAVMLIIFVSCFAFLATSIASYEHYESSYSFSGTKVQFLKKLKVAGATIFDSGQDKPQDTQFQFPAPEECHGYIDAPVQIRELNGSCEVRLSRLSITCPKKGGEKIRLLRKFEDFGKKVGLKKIV